jgi:hypothetical protein
MPFCPKCRYEYLPTVSECPDCEVKLVLSLPLEPEEPEGMGAPEGWEQPAEPEAMESYDNWVPLARFTSTEYADMVLETLQSKDIPAVLSGQPGNSGRRSEAQPASGAPADRAMTLFVPEEFAQEASMEARIVIGEDWDKVKLGNFEG